MAHFRTRLLAALGVPVVVVGLAACGDDANDTDTAAGSTATSAATTTAASSSSASTPGSSAPSGGVPDCANPPDPVIDPGDGGVYAPELDPANFVDRIDNPYMPLLPGSRWVYEGEADGETERTEIVVTDETKQVMGITATVVRDTVSIEGETEEDTYDWFAQDADGNVWYLGEDSTSYEDGKPKSTEGSWEGGVDGALPGIVMEADPAVGDAYRQEWYPCEALDLAEVARTGESVSVEAGDYEDVLVIKEWNPLEPDTVEEKSYAPGVGVVLEEKVQGGEERAQLIEFTPGS